MPSTPHTKNNATTCQLTRPSSQPDAPAQPSVQPTQPSLPISPAQPSSHRAQLTQPQTTELSQRKDKLLHQLIQTANEHQSPIKIPILLRSHHCIVCHQSYDQRGLGTAQLIANIISYHQCSNQD